jgi:thiamine-monophosphate kinase
VGSPKPVHTQALATEDELVHSIRGILGDGIESFGLRDDAGLVPVPGGGTVLVSVDSVVDGIHVDLSLCEPADVGWKALMQALSDLAAMGAAPVGALVALCVPGGSGEGQLALGVMRGVAEAASATGCPVVGGDVSEAASLVVAVTVLGTVADGGAPVPRSGARPGDVLVVTGPCGGSAAGLRELRAGGDDADRAQAYRRPVARLPEGEAARRAGARAMIDVSDGLALDLHRLADASVVGFELCEVPVAPGATLDEALGGGEDYELVIALAPADLAAFEARLRDSGRRPPLPLGVAVADPDVRSLGPESLGRHGWQHRVG